MQANRDLRNAITTLQFEACGCLSKKTSKQETGSKPGSASKGSKQKKENVDHTKDMQLSIFHALGKFLYNKRIHPKTKEVQQLPYKMMKDANNRPKLYFDH